MSWYTSNSCVVVDLPLRNPCLKLIERLGEVMITVIKNATFQYFGDNTKKRDWSLVRCYGGIIFFENRGNIGKLTLSRYHSNRQRHIEKNTK
jgi:hypothetical protein